MRRYDFFAAILFRYFDAADDAASFFRCHAALFSPMIIFAFFSIFFVHFISLHFDFVTLPLLPLSALLLRHAIATLYLIILFSLLIFFHFDCFRCLIIFFSFRPAYAFLSLSLLIYFYAFRHFFDFSPVFASSDFDYFIIFTLLLMMLFL